MWRMLAILSCAGIIFAAVYLVSRIGRFTLVRRLTGDRRWGRILAGAVVVAAVLTALYLSMGQINMAVCLIHIVVIWMLCDLVGLVVSRLRGKKGRYYIAGAAAAVLSAAYLSMGWYFAHHVYETDYLVETDKDLGGRDLRVILFADSHVGATFHSREFAGYLQEMEALSADVLLIAGDFIDDDTSKEDMIGCCEALGRIKTTYGVYFVYGNHDRGYYGAEYRGYDGDDLQACLEANGVTVLEDDCVLIGDRFYLIGRQDASRRDRADMQTLLEGLDQDKYKIVIDHQPHDYDAQEESGVDMVLSGHTHGGWLFPINYLGELNGTDDKTYGREKSSDTEFIVTSGISDWALKFKTGCIAEYVVVDIVSSVR